MFFWRNTSIHTRMNQQIARELRALGDPEGADKLLGINREKIRSWQEEQARKARRRAERRGKPFGRLLNILGL